MPALVDVIHDERPILVQQLFTGTVVKGDFKPSGDRLTSIMDQAKETVHIIVNLQSDNRLPLDRQIINESVEPTKHANFGMITLVNVVFRDILTIFLKCDVILFIMLSYQSQSTHHHHSSHTVCGSVFA